MERDRRDRRAPRDTSARARAVVRAEVHDAVADDRPDDRRDGPSPAGERVSILDLLAPRRARRGRIPRTSRRNLSRSRRGARSRDGCAAERSPIGRARPPRDGNSRGRPLRYRSLAVPRPVRPAATALIVVDVQNDFADPAGSLFVQGAADDPAAGQLARRGCATEAGAFVVYTQDWHPESTPHFAKDGGIWPVHCVGGTWGAELHPALDGRRAVGAKGSNGEDGYSGLHDARPDDRRDDADRARGAAPRARASSGSSSSGSRPTTASARRRSTRSGSASGPRSSQDAIAAVDLAAGDGERALGAMRGRRLRARATAGHGRPSAVAHSPERQPCASTSSTRPTSCSGPTTRRGRPIARPGRHEPVRRRRAWSTSCSTCSARRARRTSAAPPTTSSSRSGTTCSRATSRRPGCPASCSTSSRSPRTRSGRSGSSSGRWSSSRPTTRSPPPASGSRPDPAVEQVAGLHARQGHGPARATTSGSCCSIAAAGSPTTSPP